MIFALKGDVVPKVGTTLSAGNVQLREGKRPRPLVLRMNVGDCLTINFTNYLATTPVDAEQPATRTASIHVIGMQLADGINSDGSNVGQNASSQVAPGYSTTYKLYAEREGTYLLYSTGANTGGEGNGGSLTAGLFGAVNVQATGAEWYRSQVTQADLQLATTGTTADGHPKINYNAVYPSSHPRAGLPILKMTKVAAASPEIVHSDLTAIITGPNAGRFPTGTYKPNPAEPDRDQPFREFTTIYHDEIMAVQAFDQFRDPELQFTLHSVRDGFAINYGTGGAGAEVLANRLGVGPMANCTECKYEEFFLTSWVVGDPAQVVDVPANASLASNKTLKATKVFYPDDPSNVYQSYLRDHVKFRVLHGGAKEHHIHHQHAKQWLLTPDSDNSTYLDSQAIGPGSAYTLEMVYHGSGNRNLTPGDAIFHCHFYPHFAQGMWALWRAHDVFESGTALDADGKPAVGARALPDGEIAAGTPIPAIVPLPTLAMAPMPEASVAIVNGQPVVTGTGNPGFPFFVPGVAGHRPPKPPLDTIDDGGLPRHIITGGVAEATTTRLDFNKVIHEADAQAIPETGTPVEVAAMNFHAQRFHNTFRPDGTPATGTSGFVTNGRPAVAGAPFADPCLNDAGQPVGTPRTYKAAHIQLDLKINKAGWHIPQARILALWQDIDATRMGTRPPEPLFIRANTNDCVTFYYTNLVPNVYEQDDFQVKTPTDVIGQHIHLVKFDVLASDGAGNGWNYEDGNFSPDEVIERINAINARGGLNQQTLTPKAHPVLGVLGAQTSVQRWYVDSLLNNRGVDRTLRTVFTHDHFGPSTHQQVGLYAGLLTEPAGSTWRDSETGVQYGTRPDGGPTGWKADILTTNVANSYREFMLEFADFALAYTADNKPVNPPARNEVGLPKLLEVAPTCPGGQPRPCPEAIAADDVGTMTLNYRNEPIALRVRDPLTNAQAAGEAGDLSNAFRSDILRADPKFNVQPSFYPTLTPGVIEPGDPFTPLMRVYDKDKVQIRMLVGAQEEGHNFSINGLNWLFEVSDTNSGFRASQFMGISEHFEFSVPLMPGSSTGTSTDFLYKPGSSVDDLWNGLWGIIRSYKSTRFDLKRLPSNPTGNFNTSNFSNTVCPKTAPTVNFDITAVTARQLPSIGGTLVYNGRIDGGFGKLHDPTAIMFFRTSDLVINQATRQVVDLKPGVPVEPLILRARAGDCINVKLDNKIAAATYTDLPGFSTLPMIVENFNANDLAPSMKVGLHPQLVALDPRRSDGMNVGLNPVQTVNPGDSKTYIWYAGDIRVDGTGTLYGVPIEYGAISLNSSDPIKHSNKGAIGALIIEPENSTWVEDAASRASATVTKVAKNGVPTTFRDFVLLFQNDVNLRLGEGAGGLGDPVPNLAETEDPEDSGHQAFNYRTEPLWKRMGFAPNTPLGTMRTLDFTNVLNNAQVGGDPVTPVFTATAGTQVRFRVVHPGGHQRNNVFNLHGHVWRAEPYISGSTEIGANPLSEWRGASEGIGPSSHFDFIPVNGAGGKFGVRGDYLYRDFQSFTFSGGLWGIFRVQ